ncbi:MAG: hypothetical protein BWX86_02526 [Verrucomicrobia bacterium ADurb.Bin122]|nr:MAG: hypothetical protein BWX86_02526 [Verrucomicrobia bacterium ADurb.Bin122]
MGVDDVDVARGETGVGDGLADALGLARRVGQHVVGRVAVDVVAGDFAVDFGAAGEGVVEALQRVEAAAFGDDDAVAGLVEGAGGLVRVFVRGERALGFKRGEDAEGAGALAHAAADRQIDFAEAQHLRGVDDAEVAGGAGGAERVRGAGDAEVERGLAGGVVGDGAGVVVVRPVLGVVVVLGERVDFVFRLDVAVLGAADVHAHAVLVETVPSDAAVGDGFPRAINGDGAGARAHAELFFLLVLQRIEVAEARDQFAHVAHIDGLNTGHTGE